MIISMFCISFFFNDTATTEIYTLSLHDALPIFSDVSGENLRICHGTCHNVNARDRTRGVKCHLGIVVPIVGDADVKMVDVIWKVRVDEQCRFPGDDDATSDNAIVGREEIWTCSALVSQPYQ